MLRSPRRNSMSSSHGPIWWNDVWRDRQGTFQAQLAVITTTARQRVCIGTSSARRISGQLPRRPDRRTACERNRHGSKSLYFRFHESFLGHGVLAIGTSYRPGQDEVVLTMLADDFRENPI